MKISFINYSIAPIPIMSIRYLSSSIKKAKHEVGLIDTFLVRKRDINSYILRKLREQKPDIIGISTMGANVSINLEIAKMIREAYPDTILLWGGIHPTLFPDEMIHHPLVDAICIGEGEITIS